MAGRLRAFADDICVIRADGKETDKRSKLDTSLRFDLGTFKVICVTDGTEYEETVKKPNRIQIRFTQGQVTFGNPQETVHIEGSIPILVDWSQMPPTDLDLVNLEKIQSLMNGWLQEMGIREDSSYWSKFHSNRVPVISALLSPGLLLENQFASILLMFILFVIGTCLNEDFILHGY